MAYIKLAPGVARGLKKTDYIKRTGFFGNRGPSKRLETGDDKFDLYLNALPAAIRQNVVDKKLCPKTIYKEYRKEGKDVVVQRYS